MMRASGFLETGESPLIPVAYLAKRLFWTHDSQTLLQLILDLSCFCLQFSPSAISVKVVIEFFVALFISFPLVPHVLGVQIDLLNHLINQSWLITFALLLSKGSHALPSE